MRTIRAIKTSLKNAVSTNCKLGPLREEFFFAHFDELYKGKEYPLSSARVTSLSKIYKRCIDNGFNPENVSLSQYHNDKSTLSVKVGKQELMIFCESGFFHKELYFRFKGEMHPYEVRADNLSQDSVVDFIMRFAAKVPLWEAELEETLNQGMKKARKREMIQNATVGMLTERLKDTDITFDCTFQVLRVRVDFVLQRKTLSMFIYHNKFMQQVDNVVDTVKQMNELFKRLDVQWYIYNR